MMSAKPGKSEAIVRGRLQHLHEVSPTAYAFERLFYFMHRVSPERMLAPSRLDIQRDYPQADARLAAMRRRGLRIEAYVGGWVLVEAAMTALTALGPRPWHFLLAALAVIRIFDIFQITVNNSIFDRLRLVFKDEHVEAVPRQLILSVINYFELIACFGILYVQAIDLGLLGPGGPWKGADRLAEAFYFSGVTQLTIGYGDVTPLGLARLLSIIQGLFGFLFTLLILSRMVTSLPEIKPENLDG